MIAQVIYLEDYDWLIKIYYAVTKYCEEEILDELDSIGCSGIAFKEAKKMIRNNELNTGFTYTESSKHVTFILIGLTDSAEEFVNTYDHEKGHAATHIAEYYEIDPYSEQFQYLQGKIGQEMFRIAKKFMCEHCRRNLIVNFVNYGKIKMKSKYQMGKEG